MAISGFAAFTDTGTIQITSGYKNPYLVSKNSVADNQARTGLTMPPLVAIRPFISQWMTSDNSFDLNRGAGEVYVFDTQSRKNSDGFGLQVFTPDGGVAYHSSDKPMRVVDFVTGFASGFSTSQPNKQWAKAYPFDVAVLFNRAETAYLPQTASNGIVIKPHVHRDSDGTLTVSNKAAGSIIRLWDYPVVFSSHSDFLVLDVTNY